MLPCTFFFLTVAEFFSILFTYFCIVHRFKLLNDKNFYYNYIWLIMKHLKLSSEFYLLPDEGLLVCLWNLINRIKIMVFVESFTSTLNGWFSSIGCLSLNSSRLLCYFPKLTPVYCLDLIVMEARHVLYTRQ